MARRRRYAAEPFGPAVERLSAAPIDEEPAIRRLVADYVGLLE